MELEQRFYDLDAEERTPYHLAARTEDKKTCSKAAGCGNSEQIVRARYLNTSRLSKSLRLTRTIEDRDFGDVLSADGTSQTERAQYYKRDITGLLEIVIGLCWSFSSAIFHTGEEQRVNWLFIIDIQFAPRLQSRTTS